MVVDPVLESGTDPWLFIITVVLFMALSMAINMAINMDHALVKIDALVPRDHVVWVDWDLWHARLLYDDRVRAHLPKVCKQLFSPYREEKWVIRLFKQLALL